MTTATVFAATALFILLINVILSFKSDSNTAIFTPRSRPAQIAWSAIWIVVMLFWFATRCDLMTTTTYLAILFGCFAAMQLSELIRNLSGK